MLRSAAQHSRSGSRSGAGLLRAAPASASTSRIGCSVTASRSWMCHRNSPPACGCSRPAGPQDRRDRRARRGPGRHPHDRAATSAQRRTARDPSHPGRPPPRTSCISCCWSSSLVGRRSHYQRPRADLHPQEGREQRTQRATQGDWHHAHRSARHRPVRRCSSARRDRRILRSASCTAPWRDKARRARGALTHRTNHQAQCHPGPAALTFAAPGSPAQPRG
jgi:hypothetical protein